MDDKALAILQHYRELIEQRKFDEYDILGFLIFIRERLGNEYKYITEFAHLIAHRERYKGVIMNCISVAIDNAYQTKSDGRTVVGYYGMKYETWVKEWQKLAEKFNISMDKDIIKEITMCVFSLTQNTKYDDKNGHSGRVCLFQGKDKSLALSTIGDESGALFVCFAKFGKFDFTKELSAGYFKKPVEAIRIDGKLKLKYEGEYIID